MKLYSFKNQDWLSHTDYFFKIEKNKWIFTELISEAKIVVVSENEIVKNPNIADMISEDQIVLFWLIECSGDHANINCVRNYTQNLDFLKKHKKTIFVHTNRLDNNDPKYIYNDIMFNREKLYFTEYSEDMCAYKFWVWSLPQCVYALSDINKTFQDSNKTFLAMTRVRNIESAGPWSFQDIKLKLQNFLYQMNANMYISDPAKNVVIKTNGWDDDPIFSQIDFKFGGLFSPAGDYYYNTSYVSVGIETIYKSNEIFYPSEKYLDHLIKGNFPLIFSGPNVISNLKKYYDFKFPDWIDYSYDSIDDLEQRFEAYLQSIKKIATIPLNELHNLYLQDKHILEHNRNVFFSKPYDSLYDKVEKSIDALGW